MKKGNEISAWKEAPEGPVRDVAMALIGCLPFGSAFQLVAGRVWQDPTQQRMQSLLMDLAERVHLLSRQHNIDLAALLGREEVQPVLAQAIDAAGKSLGREKLEAIRNAAFKGMTDDKADFDTTSMMFSLINQLSNPHFCMMKAIVDNAHPALSGSIAGDLHALGVQYFELPGELELPEISGINGKFYDRATVEKNKMVLADLASVGVIETRYRTAKSILDYDPVPANNLPSSYHLTARGRVLFDYIFNDPAKPPKRDADASSGSSI